MNKLFQFSELEVKYKTAIEPGDRVKITCSNDGDNVFRQLIGDDTIELYETFCVLLVNRANEVIGAKVVSSGGTAGCVVDPKLIFSIALQAMASGVILCHNHPSGNLKASQADIEITKKLVAGGKILDIQVLDHLILSPVKGSHFSFANEGLI